MVSIEILLLSVLLGGNDNYTHFDFVVATILLSLATQLLVIPNIISLSLFLIIISYSFLLYYSHLNILNSHIICFL